MPVSMDKPVCLTRSAPFTVDSDHLVFYDVIGPSIISQSSVLSSLVEAGGEAKLPESVSIDDFRTYIQAAQGDPWMFSSLAFASMCRVIQVRTMRSL